MQSDDLNNLCESLVQEARAAAHASCRSITPLPVLHMIAGTLRRMDETSALSPQASQRACQAGCSACCFLQVAVTVPEALWIADQLRSSLPEAEFEAVRESVRSLAQRVSPLTMEERAAVRLPCALLSPDGACGIYPFRPLGCRGFTSLDRGLCEQALAQDEPGHSGPMDRLAWAASAALAEGLCAGLRLADVDDRHYEFHSAVSRALDMPDAAAHWIRGEDVFGDCGRVISGRIRG